MHLAGMASGRGRSLLNVADRAPGGAELAVLVADRADAPVLDGAADRGVPTEVVERADDESRESHERRVLDRLADYEVDLVCLEGYDRVLTDRFLDAVDLALNAHPSLLPAFPGRNAPEQALDAGARTAGCTVHVVTREVNAGPIVTQEPVPVREDDTAADLAARITEEGAFRAYPRAIRWFAGDRVTVDRAAGTVAVEGDDDRAFPARRTVSNDHVTDLRYGENPHQAAAVYADPTCEEASVVGADQLNPAADALSYNNYNDGDGALDVVKEFEAPAAAVIKHANPAGCATADTVAEAYERALSTDPKSAFGGIVALNRDCDAATAELIVDSFKVLTIAPGYTGDALEVLREKESMPVLEVDGVGPDQRPEGTAEKSLVGGRLVQDRDRQRLTHEDLEVVTERRPTDEQVESMLFGWQVVKHVTSNAVIFTKGTETVGVGAGQLSRVDAVKVAKMKAEADAEGKTAEGGVMVSDAFFPFPDNVEVAAEAGIEAVVQPGGSKRDDEVIEACDELGLAMAFTGQRAFRHD